jgi:phage recombination protein Bet
MASRLNVDPNKLLDTLKATVFKGCSNEELLALIIVSNQYGLSPLLKEIYAFPGKNGGIVPMVPIDGWTKIINRQEGLNGFKFLWEFDDDGKPISCTCVLFVKGREHPVEVTEFYEECYRKTQPWDTMPRRMLRHKALMQAGRYAFGFAGIYDEDEALDKALTMEIPSTRTLKEVTVSTSVDKPEQSPQSKDKEQDKPRPRSAQDELSTLVIEAGHSFDVFAAWGREMFPNMEWENITTFDEVPAMDAKRFVRAHVGLLKALSATKGGVAV